MKLLLTLAVATLFVACSSKQKQGDVKSATPATQSSSKKDAKAATTTDASAKTTCKKGKEERTLEVVAKGNGCEVNYTKAGETTHPASSVHGTDHCNKTVTKIKGNLEKAGYTCN